MIANLSSTGSYPQIAARLLDVDPAAGTETLVARGLYRLDPSKPDGTQAFELHPGAWHFAAGHVVKLELLGTDVPYSRPNNEQFSITVTDLQLRLPVHEAPGAPGTPGAVTRPRPAFVVGGSCAPLPTSRIFGVHASRHRISVAGSAREIQCAQTSSSARRRQRVARVYVTIYEPASRGRCRFLTPRGLGKPRGCSRPLELAARGASHWKLSLRVPIPAGTYFVRSDAIDLAHHHQRHTTASFARVQIR